jgi:hypothetical protein
VSIPNSADEQFGHSRKDKVNINIEVLGTIGSSKELDELQISHEKESGKG